MIFISFLLWKYGWFIFIVRVLKIMNLSYMYIYVFLREKNYNIIYN